MLPVCLHWVHEYIFVFNSETDGWDGQSSASWSRDHWHEGCEVDKDGYFMSVFIDIITNNSKNECYGILKAKCVKFWRKKAYLRAMLYFIPVFCFPARSQIFLIQSPKCYTMGLLMKGSFYCRAKSDVSQWENLKWYYNDQKRDPKATESSWLL